MLKIFLTFFLVSFSFFVKAELRIDITQGNTEPTPLALLQFNSKNLEEEKISFDINKVVSNNLERSGLFSILPKKLFINERIEFGKKPSFPGELFPKGSLRPQIRIFFSFFQKEPQDLSLRLTTLLIALSSTPLPQGNFEF